MVKLIVKNTKEVDEANVLGLQEWCEGKLDYYHNLFKNYDKELKMEVIFNKTSSLYKVSVSLNMKSKKMLLAKEGKDLMKLVAGLFSDFKKMVKKQYELERKDYEYKRKR